MPFCVFDVHIPHANIQQPRRRPSVPFAPHVSPSVNPAKGVVVVAVALGLETAEVLANYKLSTRGTRAFGPARHGDGLRQRWASSYVLLNKNAMNLLTIPACL